jgi:SsrA-binding protein
LVTNRKAPRDFIIMETFEAGIALQGTEVKSLKAHRGNLNDSFARIVGGEVFLMNMHVNPWTHGNIYNHEPTRTRKLLLHKKEILGLIGTVSAKGKVLIPLKLYLKKGIVKVKLAIAQAKSHEDKRETIKRKTAEREIRQAAGRRR